MAEGVNTATGEVVPLPAVQAPFSMTEYVSGLKGRNALGEQQALAAAYDAACAALIGPNDVQVEGNRTFKKKSAWRKLARYFNISVEVVRADREVLADGHFLATVTARAVAPWGQRYEEIGACCTDEATGRRVITVADAIATASTRASNRAVSNLIAMGEVSAEEMQKGDPQPRNASPRAANVEIGVPVLPFGKLPPEGHKGVPLKEMPTTNLASALKWAQEKGKYDAFQRQAEEELESRRQVENDKPQRVTSSESGGTGLLEDDDAEILPF